MKMKNLKNDPDVKAILESGQPISSKSAMKLLSNPAVKDMVDQKEFMERAKELILRQIEMMETRPSA